MVDHILNRGNGRLRLFHKDGGYDAFEQVLVEELKLYPVDLLTSCLMPNHWRPEGSTHLLAPGERRRGLSPRGRSYIMSPVPLRK
jgi:hypothetical protein